MIGRFLVRVMASDLPLDAAASLIALLSPWKRLGGQRHSVKDAARWPWGLKDENLDLRNVQPTGVLWGIVKFQARQKNRRRLHPHDGFEGAAKMGVQVVQYQ